MKMEYHTNSKQETNNVNGDTINVGTEKKESVCNVTQACVTVVQKRTIYARCTKSMQKC